MTLHWNTAENNEDNRVNLNTSYVVTIISEQLESNSSTIMTTSNTSIQLALYCDQEYNISVVARNCVGTSEPAETHITRDYFGIE